jgi:hypothetical protein
VKVKSTPNAIALLMLGLTISSIAAPFLKGGSPSKMGFPISSIAAPFLKGGSPSKMAQGEVRCEGAGAVVISIDGADYAVNGMASRHYPPIQRVWNSATYPESDIDRIIVRGLTLCDWGLKSHSTLALNVPAID